jgi:hypothetical protein
MNGGDARVGKPLFGVRFPQAAQFLSRELLSSLRLVHLGTAIEIGGSENRKPSHLVHCQREMMVGDQMIAIVELGGDGKVRDFRRWHSYSEELWIVTLARAVVIVMYRFDHRLGEGGLGRLCRCGGRGHTAKPYGDFKWNCEGHSTAGGNGRRRNRWRWRWRRWRDLPRRRPGCRDRGRCRRSFSAFCGAPPFSPDTRFGLAFGLEVQASIDDMRIACKFRRRHRVVGIEIDAGKMQTYHLPGRCMYDG